ncbi:MAG: hydrogenase maturation nickel metallochaperone HypA [Spirochaetales bacterium]|nr:hydrogenase maturation nickel metallochaperone HypA [Spirochaetales bacterium]
MHELGIVMHIAETVIEVMKEEELTEVKKIVLQVGELSSVIPRYLEECYPAAVDGTILETTELEIEILPGNGRCKKCGEVYNLIKQKRICPGCGAEHFELLSGTEFNLKEILAQ